MIFFAIEYTYFIQYFLCVFLFHSEGTKLLLGDDLCQTRLQAAPPEGMSLDSRTLLPNAKFPSAPQADGQNVSCLRSLVQKNFKIRRLLTTCTVRGTMLEFLSREQEAALSQGRDLSESWLLLPPSETLLETEHRPLHLNQPRVLTHPVVTLWAREDGPLSWVVAAGFERSGWTG